MGRIHHPDHSRHKATRKYKSTIYLEETRKYSAHPPPVTFIFRAFIALCDTKANISRQDTPLKIPYLNSSSMISMLLMDCAMNISACTYLVKPFNFSANIHLFILLASAPIIHHLKKFTFSLTFLLSSKISSLQVPRVSSILLAP